MTNYSGHAIESGQLVREFRKGPRAVDGIDLAVSKGEIYGFLGPNGAGKSTTVLMLTTLLPPTSGSARVGGFDVVHQGAQVRGVIGAALQEAALDPVLTGREHMRLQAALQGLPRSDRARRGDELLERVGLSEAADRRVRGYSGGMKRRLDLALALVHNPSILFLDEPTTGLDVQSRTALWEEVARLASEEGVTVFLTTQYLEEADALADRVGIIDRGRIVAEGTPAALKAEIGRPTVEAIPQSAEARELVAAVLGRFGEPCAGSVKGVAVRLRQAEDALADVVRALDAAGLKVADLRLHQPTLDDVAHDVETGFLNRLQLTPVRGAALLAGELAGVIAFGIVTALVYIVVGVIAGAHVEAGVAGVLVLLSLAAVISLGFGGLGALAALRTGSGEAVQGLFPLFFVVLFLSSLYLPRNLIRADWFHTIATWNPVSYILEGIRSVLITGWDGTALWRAFGVAAVLAAVALVGSALALRSRMGRT